MPAGGDDEDAELHPSAAAVALRLYSSNASWVSLGPASWGVTDVGRVLNDYVIRFEVWFPRAPLGIVFMRHGGHRWDVNRIAGHEGQVPLRNYLPDMIVESVDNRHLSAWTDVASLLAHTAPAPTGLRRTALG